MIVDFSFTADFSNTVEFDFVFRLAAGRTILGQCKGRRLLEYSVASLRGVLSGNVSDPQGHSLFKKMSDVRQRERRRRTVARKNTNLPLVRKLPGVMPA